MDTAINTTTKENVNAFEVHENGSYQNLKRGEWIMPQDSVDNYNECSDNDLHVHWKPHKEYTNKWGTHVWTSPHFSKYPGSIAKTVAESEEHKKLKNWLFTKMKKDDLQFVFSKSSKKYKFDNCVKLSELDIDWNKYDIEVHTKGYKTLIADILLQFKNKHPLLGSGIFIEVQLSSQTKKETYNRSFARAMHGYSTAWLFKEDFLFDDESKDIQLKEDKITVFSFASELKYSGKEFVKNLKNSVEEQCRYLDNKIKETNSNGENVLSNINNLFHNVEGKMSLIKNKALKEIDNKKDKLVKDIIKLEDNPFELVVKKYKEDINIQLRFTSNQINKEVEEAITHINTVARNRMKEVDQTYPGVIPCKKCGATMIFKQVTTRLGKKKELYECQGPHCDYVVWVK